MVSLSTDLVPIVTLGLLTFDALRIVEREDRLDGLLAQAAPRVVAAPDLEERVAAVRAMYRRLKIDPTKTRPSSEALLRRIRKGEAFPRINSLVDICNWCSLELQLPYGLYDLDRIQGSVELRLGRPGEQYVGIRKDAVHVAGRLTLADDVGPFGNPTSDSQRTMITTGSSRALVVIYAPRGTVANRLDWSLEVTSARIVELTGGREMRRLVV